ncbi:hypothetical protein L915_02714 [Phytophthora nicotianae]|uniref:PiggyBac transposable element-derived protein domain-containing protein n=1 Tax=Phytophthora nicotianae TaxID=4792 RepID=W2JMD5_PHYNI|nr:hypothetical protein L915_02714 [Phytophthora nicotianae]ETL47579.1 hypothetical protein L916_02689 [Phytophthora nicotianae]
MGITTPQIQTIILPQADYHGLYSDEHGPTDEVIAMAVSPLKLSLNFIPNTLWQQVAVDRYFAQNLTSRVNKMFGKQKTPGKKTKKMFMMQEARKPDIKPHEILRLI